MIGELAEHQQDQGDQLEPGARQQREHETGAAVADGVDLVVGNIATAAAASDLLKLGVDGIKVGIGPGSICTTRLVAGVGIPQLTALYLTSRVARKRRVTIIADGSFLLKSDVLRKKMGAGCAD